jgi:hypothetical protein
MNPQMHGSSRLARFVFLRRSLTCLLAACGGFILPQAWASAAPTTTSLAMLSTAQLTTAGIATFKFRPGLGSHSYRAAFVGTNTYVSSKSTAIALNVTGQYPTTTAIGAAGSVGNYALTATVTGASNGSSSPAGQVSFLDMTNANALLGSAALGTSTLAESFTTASVTDNNPDAIAVADFNSDVSRIW